MLRVIAGECTASFEDGEPSGTRRTSSNEHRESDGGSDGAADGDGLADEKGGSDGRHGRLICLIKPDDTVLVHDAAGYRPVAWLTRADAVAVAGDPPVVTATDGDRTLRLVCHEAALDRELPVSDAGRRVGPCPDCGGALVETRDAVTCTDCETAHALPNGAELTGERCDCGLPRMAVVRGERFDLCVDRRCESLDDAVADAFDRAWDCPDCDADLRIVRAAGLLAGCDRHPDCDVAFRLPAGEVDGACDCGLPAFATGEGRRCLDATCGAAT